MSRLQRCVCCEGQWKIKKNIDEKLNHIEVCAKQHTYTLEMVSFLIKRELKMAIEDFKQENTCSTRSHLKEVVQDVFLKRKSKSKKESTLQEFSSQKRVDAMKRLRAILRTSDRDDPDIGLPSSSPVTFLPSRLIQSQRQAEHSFSLEKTFRAYVSCLRSFMLRLMTHTVVKSEMTIAHQKTFSSLFSLYCEPRKSRNIGVCN